MTPVFVVTLSDMIGLGLLGLILCGVGGWIFVEWLGSFFTKSEPDEPETIEGIGTWSETRGRWEK